MKEYLYWARKDFESLPHPESYINDIGLVDALVVIPCKHKHDSGFRCMQFATIQNGEPTYLISGCSDVIHISGIGGYNHHSQSIDEYTKRVIHKTTKVCNWKIDCLPTSGLIRLFCSKPIYVGASVSDFEIFYKEE